MRPVTILLHIVVVMEMIFVNLNTCYLCCKRKKSKAATWGVLAVFTAVLVSLLLVILMETKNYGNGNGLFVLAGALYLIPLKYLYQDKASYITSIACTSWIYTMLVFSVSVQIANYFSEELFAPIVAGVQTFLYLLSLYPFCCIIKRKFLRLMEAKDLRMKRLLLVLSILWFLYLTMLHFYTVMDASKTAKLFIILGFGACGLFSYWIYYYLGVSRKRAEEMEAAATHDLLTGLSNRKAFYEDLAQKLSEGGAFAIYFIDLNHFKGINDKYGHLEGDRYLVRFADAIKKSHSDRGNLYRLAGDEFVFLYMGNDPARFERELKETKMDRADGFVPFGGFSVGRAVCPEDGTNAETLLSVADYNMYQDKRKGKEGSDKHPPVPNA